MVWEESRVCCREGDIISRTQTDIMLRWIMIRVKIKEKQTLQNMLTVDKERRGN